ncbi:MAG TPA: hypothetical protein PKD90_12065, partial [Phnomibacter sp.]|nr:hypothetical protein [Phnomibacter sp.]
GTLHRNLELEGQGWLIPGNRCITNAVRFGGTIGVAHFTLNKFYFEGQGSLGIGLYIYTPKSFYLRKNTGYLDGQFWLSIGLNF